MKRRIIHISEEKCSGCGICVSACHEGAIVMDGGKAKLMREDYCDGLGDCLPQCPEGAITFVEREAAPYDEAAVLKNKKEKKAEVHGCPGMKPQKINAAVDCDDCKTVPSQLGQWPVQIKLVPLSAPYFDGAKLLVAADCTAYAYGDFHMRFMKGRITLIGCPKLDGVDYSEKLKEILERNNIQSITVVRMTVPCCRGLEAAARRAAEECSKDIPVETVVISPEGKLL